MIKAVIDDRWSVEPKHFEQTNADACNEFNWKFDHIEDLRFLKF